MIAIKSQHEFWDIAASSKDFQDPFYLDALAPFLHPGSNIIEYGCGYGRILNILCSNGFANTTGFDFSLGMITRGRQQFPYLNLQHIEHASLPLQSSSVDCAIISTVMCCIPDMSSEEQVINELHRVLKPGSPLYFTDFMITDTAHMQLKYQNDFDKYKEWGIYQTTEGALVRHFSEEHISKLTSQFNRHWYYEKEFITMNGNPVKTFHGIYIKK